MRSSAISKRLVGLAAAVGIAVGSMTGAGVSFAAPAPTLTSAIGSESVTPLAIVNLGLSTRQAMNVQCWLIDWWQYPGPIDGLLGPESWKAMQRMLKRHYGYTGAIDGIVGPLTISALQRMLKKYYGYTGAIDGIAGAATQAAFKRFADATAVNC